MHRVHLERDRAQGELPGQFGVDRVVQVRVDVGDQREAARVVGGQRQQVLGRLHAGRLGAVLADHQGVVHALGLHQVAEGLRDDLAVRRVRLAPARLAEPLRPVHPGGLDRGQPHRMLVGVDQRPSVEHRRPPSMTGCRPKPYLQC